VSVGIFQGVDHETAKGVVGYASDDDRGRGRSQMWQHEPCSSYHFPRLLAPCARPLGSIFNSPPRMRPRAFNQSGVCWQRASCM